MNQETLENTEITCFADNLEINKQFKTYGESMNLQIIEYLGMEREMEKSNIWALFPKLKCLGILNRVIK